ncbi:MAG TPA: GNAT family N-acetyltransferase [Puia sp.]|nr:GNAT family N-acetyltransferase [Puia sp.]
MDITINQVSIAVIQPLRDLFLHENNFQFIYNKCHNNGWADTYLCNWNGTAVGYGSVWGKDRRQDRDTIFEFYLLPSHRKYSAAIFEKLIRVSEVNFIECQTNDVLLTSMMYEHGKNIFAERILFEDHFKTELETAHTIFRKKTDGESVAQDSGEYVLVDNNAIVATGGFVTNYNLPFIDMYYEVKEPFREKGFGALMVQYLKAEAYSMKRVPAARCNINNKASKATLLKGGMKICGYILIGEINDEYR